MTTWEEDFDWPEDFRFTEQQERWIRGLYTGMVPLVRLTTMILRDRPEDDRPADDQE